MSEQVKVLVVDDLPENIYVLSEILVNDYQVVAATSGKKAIEIATQEPYPDIILLDVMMPEMNGYEVCRALKRDDRTCDIPVIFVTALTEEKDEEYGFNVGAVDYITKPVSPPIVRARVKTHLTLKEARETLEQQNQSLIEAAKLREDVDRITRHDLKGPLSTVIGMPALLMSKENLTSQQREILRLIRESGYLMLDMINNSLNLYKMEMGNYPYQPERVELDELVKKVIVECDNLCSAHHVDVEFQLDNSSSSVENAFSVDAEELLCHSMLSNLIKNAIEASPTNGVVEVGLENLGNVTRIQVQNNGEVPEEIRDSFFDKYTTLGKPEGTGLGTYSAYMAAKTQGGDIVLDTSTPGKTILTVTLNAA